MSTLAPDDRDALTTPPAAQTEAGMLALLRARHMAQTNSGVPRWVYAEHVRCWSISTEADAIALDGHAPPYSEYKNGEVDYYDRYVHGFEVKVSRSDWLREHRTHEGPFAFGWKSYPWGRYCTHWWLVVPHKDIMRPDELPDGWGLLVGSKRLRAVHQAARRPAEPMSDAVKHIVARTAIKTDRYYSDRDVA